MIRTLEKKIILLGALLCTLQSFPQTPRISIVVVVDQFAYHYLYKLKPYFKDGLKFLFDNGIVYENAHYPHATPETGPGHTTLSTGTFPKDHGIIANSWFDATGKEIECDDADPKEAAVFSTGNNVHPYGKSAANIMVDGLSNQFVLHSEPNAPFLSFSVSIKSRAAIGTAGSLGKAIWFDKETGLFTSSKAYFNQLPDWLVNFNNTYKTNCATMVTWNLAYPRNSKAYDFNQIENYKYASVKESSAGKKMPIQCCHDIKNPYFAIYESPAGNQLTFDLAKACLESQAKKNNHVLLWVCLSPLDLVGHKYGPDSLECIDIIYHLDKQLKKFIQYAQHTFGKSNVLFALTADHGILPLQGILREQGVGTAFKISENEIVKAMNKFILDNYQLDGLVTAFAAPGFYFNPQQRATLDPATLAKIQQDLKDFLMTQRGIKNVWTYRELDTYAIDPKKQELEFYFKNQRYPGRSGDLIVQLQPYTLLTHYVGGTSHESPYNYDTHVPLVMYQKGAYEHKKVTQKVYITQFANTMAQILHIPKPSASTAELLPGIFEPILAKNIENEPAIAHEPSQEHPNQGAKFLHQQSESDHTL